MQTNTMIQTPTSAEGRDSYAIGAPGVRSRFDQIRTMVHHEPTTYRPLTLSVPSENLEHKEVTTK